MFLVPFARKRKADFCNSILCILQDVNPVWPNQPRELVCTNDRRHILWWEHVWEITGRAICFATIAGNLTTVVSLPPIGINVEYSRQYHVSNRLFVVQQVLERVRLLAAGLRTGGHVEGIYAEAETSVRTWLR